MDNTFLYTFPQWIVFAAVFMVVYGWVEHKKNFRLIGISVFIILGIISLVVLLGDFLAPGNVLSPEEIAAEELNDEILNAVPLEAKLLPGYLSFIVSSLLAIPALILEWADNKRARLFIILTSVVALLGFFIIVGTIRSL